MSWGAERVMSRPRNPIRLAARPHQARDRVQRRAFARAVAADERDDLAFPSTVKETPLTARTRS